MRKLIIAVLAAATMTMVWTAVAEPIVGGPPSLRKPLFAGLSGKNEIGPTGKRRAGDLDGAGSFAAVVDTSGGQLCFGLAVRGIETPVAAHIHKGKRGKNGPIVVTLVHPSSGDPGASSGCVAVEAQLLAKIRKHPRRYYVNVHTADFAGGAIRGQLFQRPAR